MIQTNVDCLLRNPVLHNLKDTFGLTNIFNEIEDQNRNMECLVLGRKQFGIY